MYYNYKRYAFIMSEKQSDHIDDRIYADKKLPQEKREFPNGQRSEYIRKLISRDMKDEK